MLPLDITPEHLPVLSAQHSATVSSLTTAISAAAVAAMPVPAAIDPVSRLAASIFRAYAQPFFGSTSGGVDKLLGGAEVLVPVSASYSGSDVTGGSTVGAKVVGFK